jgi:isopenicillin-N epimerase
MIASSEVNWDYVRRQFLLDEEFVHLSGFWLSSHPLPVRAAIDHFRHQLDRQPFLFVAQNEERLDCAAASSIARLLKGNPREIVLTSSTTEGLAIIYGGMAVGPGDEVLTTTHDHYSTAKCLDILGHRTGCSVRQIAMYDDGDEIQEDQLCARLLESVSPVTRVLALTWVHSCTGVKIPLAKICGRVREFNRRRTEGQEIVVCADATHAIGTTVADVAELGADFLVGACHKWLCGPRGSGFAWGRDEALRSLSPVIPSFAPAALGEFAGRVSGASRVAAAEVTPGGFHCFEHRWAVPAAVEFIENIGVRTIESRICFLASILKNGLKRIERVRLITPSSPAVSAGIVCFEVDGAGPESIVEGLLRRRIVATVSPYRKRYVRFTPAVYNTEDDLSKALVALEETVSECLQVVP